MTFVNCFGAIYTLPCIALLTRVHTLKINYLKLNHELVIGELPFVLYQHFLSKNQ